jgi:hypothetical protein
MIGRRPASALRRDIDHDWTEVLKDSDFHSSLLIALIGLLITACLISAFPLDDKTISSIALLG